MNTDGHRWGGPISMPGTEESAACATPKAAEASPSPLQKGRGLGRGVARCRLSRRLGSSSRGNEAQTKRAAEPPHVGGYRIGNGRAGWQILHTLSAKLAGQRIMTSLLTQLVRHHPIVSALRSQSGNRRIFHAVSGQFTGGQIMHALRAQFSGRWIFYAVRREFAATVSRQSSTQETTT